MKTYIFGAGASVHAGYPLANNLWPEIKQWVRGKFPPDHDFRNAVDTIESEFDSSRPFELLLTDLQERIDDLQQERHTLRDNPVERIRLIYTRVAIDQIIPHFFNTLRPRPAELYRIFATKLLSVGDAVITFNYDLALDRELRRSGKWSIGNGYGFDVSVSRYGASSCFLLKLHGSTNWRGEVFEGIEGFGQSSSPPLGHRPVIDSSEFEFLEYPEGSDPFCHGGRVRVENLIMPTAKKRFYRQTSFGREWEDFWNHLWEQGASCLTESDEIYVIGYSVPEYDERARNLLRLKIRKETVVKVCCHLGTDPVVQSLLGLGVRTSQPAEESTFERLLSHLT